MVLFQDGEFAPPFIRFIFNGEPKKTTKLGEQKTMSKYGIKNGGNIKAGNIQGNVISILTDSSGNGSGTVTFKQAMPSTAYGVGFGFEESGTTRITTGVSCAADKTQSGFKIVVTGASAVSQGIKVGYTAIDAKSAY